MVILTAYFEVAVTWSNNQGAFNVPEQVNNAFADVTRSVQQAAYLDLMRAESTLLLQTPNPPIDQLNGTLGSYFATSLRLLNLTTPQGYLDGTVRVYAESWGINLTWDQGEVRDPVSQVSLRSGLVDPNLPLASVADASRPTAMAQTEEPVYPMAVGEVSLFAVDAATGVSGWQSVPFTETVQSDLGLLEDSTSQFADASFGQDGGFAHLVEYLTTTLGELRALSGYGAGGWPGLQQTTQIASNNCGASAPSILSCEDIHDAVALASLLASLQYFRNYDPNATYAFLSSLGPGPYQTLLSTYVTNGVVDGAALLLLLLGPTPGGWSDGWIASGSGLASAAYSFVDRYKFDLFQQFWGQQAVDPTLTEPVTSWNLLASQSNQYAVNMVTQWLHQYQNWLGITITSIPKYDVTAQIPAEVGGAGGCNYVIFPGGSIEVSNTYVPDIADLILGSTNGGTGINYPYAPELFNVFENVTVTDPYAGANWFDLNEQAGYYLVDSSFVGQYTNNGAPTLPVPSPAPTGGDPFRTTLYALLQSLNASMDHKSPISTQVELKGLLDYIAYEADKDGGNYTLAGAGLPDLTTAAGLAQALYSPTYSLLTNGTNTLFSGPFAAALAKLATQASNTTWQDNAWIYGADHPDLMGPDQPTADTTNWWTMSQIASLTAREYFQELYMLWYGSAGVIPTSPVGPISYNLMDALQYNVVSPGVQHSPPYPFHEPDFAINVQNETYISVMNWMGWTGGGGPCPESGFGFGQCGFSATIYNPAYVTNGNPGICGYGAFLAARAQWYTEEGTGLPSRTWNNVAGAVTCALLGSTHPGCGGASAAQGLDSIHYDTAPGVGLGQSWWNVKNNTGDAYFGCGYVGLCPNYDAGNFTNWTLTTVAPPILSDMRSMGQTGGWLSQLYASSQQEIWQGANQSTVIDKPWLENGVPYTFWQGNYSNEVADQQLFNESLANRSAGLVLRGNGLAFTWSLPQYTIHLVDPQNDTSNMGISGMSSTWTIDLQGSISLNLTSTRMALEQKGYPTPTQLNVTVPISMALPITIYTPWNLGSGWDGLSTPLPGDPAYLQTRSLLGLTGNDYHASPNFLAGTYVSQPLDSLLSQATSVGKVLAAEGRDQAGLLAALPDRGVGASAPWAQNLTLLENTTNADLASTAGAYMGAVQANLATLDYELTKVPRGGPYTNVAWKAPAFYGNLGQLDLTTQQFNYYGYPGTATWGDSLQYNLTFGGSRVGASYYVDNNFNGASPTALPAHGFCGSWGPTSAAQSAYCGSTAGATAGSYSLQGYWAEFATPYHLGLSGSPTRLAPTETSTSLHYPSLSVPYLGPNWAYPADLSVSAVGALPSVASSAFLAAVQGYLPSPGVFPNYVAEQQWQAGLLYDQMGSSTAPGVTGFGYGTALRYGTAPGASFAANFSISLQEAGGLFGDPVQQGNVSSFLQWYEVNHLALSYGLGCLSQDPTTLASASPQLLTFVYRNMTLETGDMTVPSSYAYLSSNLAFSEGDLGGTGGGLSNSPTILIGGGAPGTWEFGGTLTEL